MKIGIQLFRSCVFGKVYYDNETPRLDLLLCNMFDGTYQGCANVKRMNKHFPNYSTPPYKTNELNGVWNTSWFNK